MMEEKTDDKNPYSDAWSRGKKEVDTYVESGDQIREYGS